MKVPSDLDATEYKGRILKPHEKAELTDKIVRSRDKYPVSSYADMKKTINSLQHQFLTNSLYTWSHTLVSVDEGMDLYATWSKGWTKLSEDDKDAKHGCLRVAHC